MKARNEWLADRCMIVSLVCFGQESLSIFWMYNSTVTTSYPDINAVRN